MAQVIILKSNSYGDISHSHSIGLWQYRTTAIGHNTPIGSVVVLKLVGSDRAYMVGMTTCFPATLAEGSQPVDWPSVDDQQERNDYTQEFAFAPLQELLEISWEEFMNDVKEYSAGKSFRFGGTAEVPDKLISDYICP